MSTMNFMNGIELEFICVFKTSTFVDRLRELYDQYEQAVSVSFEAGLAVWHFLKQADLPASGFEQLTRHPFARPAMPPHSTWVVKHEILSLSDAEAAQLPDGWKQEAIEIASPAMLSEENEWQRQLARVLRTLKWMSTNFDCSFVTNATAGLHVHIGLPHGEQLPVALVKRIFQLSTAFESRLDTLHAGNRVRAPGLDVPTFDDAALPVPGQPKFEDDLTGGYCAPLSYFHRTRNFGVPTHSPSTDSPPDNLFAWLQQIEQASTHAELGAMIEMSHRLEGERGWVWLVQDDDTLDGHNATLNLANLYPCFEGALAPPTHTVEFRQHAGSLNLDEIASWVRVLVQLTTYCQGAADAEFLGLLLRAADVDFLLRHLLAALGCGPDLRAYYAAPKRATLEPFGPAPLAPLRATNAAEQQLLWDSVGPRVHHKYLAAYYGLHPTVGCPFPFASPLLESMLHCAFADARAADPRSDDRAVAQTARALVLGKLWGMYANMSPTAAGLGCPAVLDELRAWMHQHRDFRATVYGMIGC